MKALPEISSAALLAIAAAGGPGLAIGGEHQASFAVTVTVHKVIGPLVAADLCEDVRPIEILGAGIEVKCPDKVPESSERSSPERTQTGAMPGAPEQRQRPEVLVTF